MQTGKHRTGAQRGGARFIIEDDVVVFIDNSSQRRRFSDGKGKVLMAGVEAVLAGIHGFLLCRKPDISNVFILIITVDDKGKRRLYR